MSKPKKSERNNSEQNDELLQKFDYELYDISVLSAQRQNDNIKQDCNIKEYTNVYDAINAQVNNNINNNVNNVYNIDQVYNNNIIHNDNMNNSNNKMHKSIKHQSINNTITNEPKVQDVNHIDDLEEDGVDNYAGDVEDIDVIEDVGVDVGRSSQGHRMLDGAKVEDVGKGKGEEKVLKTHTQLFPTPPSSDFVQPEITLNLMVNPDYVSKQLSTMDVILQQLHEMPLVDKDDGKITKNIDARILEYLADQDELMERSKDPSLSQLQKEAIDKDLKRITIALDNLERGLRVSTSKIKREYARINEKLISLDKSAASISNMASAQLSITQSNDLMLSKKPASNAAQFEQKVIGITLSEGGDNSKK